MAQKDGKYEESLAQETANMSMNGNGRPTGNRNQGYYQQPQQYAGYQQQQQQPQYGGYYQGQGSFNAGANSFVPQATAQAFVPGGYAPQQNYNRGGQGYNQNQYQGYQGGYQQQGYQQQGYQQQQQAYQAPSGGLPRAVYSAPAPVATPVKATEPVVVKATPAPAATQEDWEKETPVVPAPAPTPVKAEAPVAKEPREPKAEAPKKPRKKVFLEEKDHLNILFIGHVDAGKSTIGGQIMFQTGMVDKRTLEKYEKEAKEKNRESWYLSWCMDTSSEEREKGKTVEVGRASFNTEKKNFTVLDAPGHKSFVPNMIAGAAQADVGILVISARRGEFEAGFDKGGQTCEHAMLCKTAGIKFLVVLVNKMDEPSVAWDPARYDEIVGKLTPFLRRSGYNMKDVHFLPASGLTGANIKEPIPKGVFDHYKGPSLLSYLDDLKPMERMNEAPVRLPIIEKFKDMGTMVLGKLESGVISRGDSLMLMPNKVLVEVQELAIDEEEIEQCGSGNNVRLKLKNIDENDVHVGFVLCEPDSLVPAVKVFDCQLVILDVETIICAGYTCVLHIHSAAEEVKFQSLIATIDRKTGTIAQKKPRFVKQDQIIIARMETLGGAVCMELFKEFPQLGRFTLRDKGKTVAIGKVVKHIS